VIDGTASAGGGRGWLGADAAGIDAAATKMLLPLARRCAADFREQGLET